MFARISRYEVPLDRLDADVKGAQDTERRVTEMPGSMGLYYFVDRGTGKTMAVTLWESEQAMRDSESAASQLRRETTAANGGRLIDIERYEVAARPRVTTGAR